MTDVPLKCDCGAFRAVVRRAGPRHGNRVVCYCAWCQAFARYLGREAEVLDEHGGTDVYQVSPGRLEILQGKDQLAGVHLSRQPTLRWHTACCRSPIGNTLDSNRLPFIGLIHTAIDTSGVAGGLDQLIGPVRGRVNGGSAYGDTSGLRIHKSAPPGAYWRVIKLMAWGRLSGEYKNSPLFDRESGKPVIEPSRQKNFVSEH